MSEDQSESRTAVLRHLSSKRGSVGILWQQVAKHPELAERLGALGEYLRFDGQLNPAQRESLILLVARHRACKYVEYHHTQLAITAGIDPTDERGWPISFELRQIAKNMLDHGVHSSSTTEISLTPEEIEAAVLVGYYDMITSIVRLFKIEDRE